MHYKLLTLYLCYVHTYNVLSIRQKLTKVLEQAIIDTAVS